MREFTCIIHACTNDVMRGHAYAKALKHAYFSHVCIVDCFVTFSQPIPQKMYTTTAHLGRHSKEERASYDHGP